jgi:PIN domain
MPFTHSASAQHTTDGELAVPTALHGPPGLVLDACILMSGLLRPLLLNLAKAGLLVPLWTDKIGQEWQRNAARLWPIEPELLENEWQLMQGQFPHSNMGDVTEFEVDLRHTDRKDKHVAATGIAGVSRQVAQPISVLTWNLKDFSRSELRKQQLGLIDPDRLLSQWWATQSSQLQQHIEATVEDLFSTGRRQPEPVVAMLKRDRLFRLAGCYERMVQATRTT